MSGSATWVYAVTRDLDPDRLRDVGGVGGGPVRAVPGGRLTAVTGSVDAQEFSEEAFERRLSDPAELAALARAHHQVVEAVATAGPVLPLRLATVYSDDERVRELLAQRQTEFTATLDWLAGRTECGVKAWASPQAVSADADQPESADREPGEAQRTGAAYLSRRRAQLGARAKSRQEAAERGADIHRALSAMAAAACVHQVHDVPSDEHGAGDQGLMVLNGAYLVETAAMARFAESAQSVVGELPGFSLEVTGPWPPYSFADGPEGSP
jgi:Gas vesicle synthesis protein GvpL/GvpF